MSDTVIPPFSGEHPKCPKCGNHGAYTEWKPARGEVADYGIGGTAHVIANGDYEHLRRRCERCDYEWREATIEQGTLTISAETAQHLQDTP